MIKRLLLVVCLFGAGSLAAIEEEVQRAELFGGNSWAVGIDHCVNDSVTGNVNSSVGMTAELSGQFSHEQYGPVLLDQKAQTIQTGPRFSRRDKKYTPFFYVLVGATRFKDSTTIGGARLSEADTGFTSTVGGGLDVKLNDRIA